jgi:hypothetical protein
MIVARQSKQADLIRYFDLTSRLNSTPPIGDPNATEMPAAAAAESTSRLRAVSS